MKSKLIRGSLTNSHVHKEDPGQKTADHFSRGVGPMASDLLIYSLSRSSCGISILAI
jgi:hypothetical protein